MKTEFLSAVLLISKNPERLAAFYRDVVGLPIEEEDHGESEKHYGCELGDLHFAIHPIENFEDTGHGTGSMKIAFTVFDIENFVKSVQEKGFEVEHAPRDMGFAKMTALTDPDGNYVEFTQLSDRWFQHLQKRRAEGHDVVQKWQSSKK